MTVPFWCVVAVMLMPIVLALSGIPVRVRALGDADNKLPRLQIRQLEGMPARLFSAQENGWEATIVFATTVVLTHLAGLAPAEAAPYTLAFVALRVVYTVLYLMNLDVLRSLTFVASMGCVITLLVKAA